MLDSDESYHTSAGVWREFQSREMAQRLEELGISFFDLSRDPVTGEYRNFIDAAHPSERGMLISLISLCKDTKFTAVLPKLDPRRLEEKLVDADEQAEAFSIFGNAN